MNAIVRLTVCFVPLFVFLRILLLYWRERRSLPKLKNHLKLFFTGFFANALDTLGVGSFAVVVACNKSWGLIDDKKLLGTMNGHSVLPAMIQSVLFLQLVAIDPLTVIVLVGGACLGGFSAGFFVSKLDKQTIRLVMCIGFMGVAEEVFGHQIGLTPLEGEQQSIKGSSLFFGFVAMCVMGMLPAIGIGFYVPVQILLFFLGLAPLAAFPIMTTAGAIVQSSTAYSFVIKREIAILETLFLAACGILGVFVAVPFLVSVQIRTLRWLLFAIVVYNTFMIWKSYQKEREKQVDARCE